MAIPCLYPVLGKFLRFVFGEHGAAEWLTFESRGAVRRPADGWVSRRLGQ